MCRLISTGCWVATVVRSQGCLAITGQSGELNAVMEGIDNSESTVAYSVTVQLLRMIFKHLSYAQTSDNTAFVLRTYQCFF
jgi:hypothetical protein